MKLRVRGVALLLPLLLTACMHKTNQAQNQPPLAPPIEDAPPSKPDNAPKNLPPPVISEPQPATPAVVTPPPPPPPKPVAKKKKPKPAQPAQQPAAEDHTEIAANKPPEVSAVGQLSSGEPADVRKDTANSIAETERALNAITRTLNDQEQKTSAQIREDLKQAKAALASGDVDGAHTLAVKAKVLLGDLSQ